MYRAYHAPIKTAEGTLLRNSQGIPTNAVYIFVTMLRKLLKEHQPEYIAASFDLPGRTFRDDIVSDYKANRRPMPDELAGQIPLVHRACEALGVPILTHERYEADDVIGTMTERAASEGYRVAIVTGDKDFFQLVRDGIRVYNPRDEGTWYDAAGVKEKFGVTPEQVVDVLALMGDTIDNIKGVPGIGEKGARELIATYGTLDALLERAAEVPQKKYREALLAHEAEARQSRELLQIHTTVPVEFDINAFRYRGPTREACYELFSELGFRSLVMEYAPTADTTATDYQLVTTLEGVQKVADELTAAGRFAMRVLPDSPAAVRAGIVGIAFSIAPRQAWYVPIGHVDADPDRLRQGYGGPPKLDAKAEGVGVQQAGFDDLFDLSPDEQPLRLCASALCVLCSLCDPRRLEARPRGRQRRENRPRSEVRRDRPRPARHRARRRWCGHDAGELPARLDANRPSARTGRARAPELQGAHRGGRVRAGRQGGEPRRHPAGGAPELRRRTGRPGAAARQPSHADADERSAQRADKLYREIERPLIPVLARMEQAGVRLDAEALAAQSSRVERELAVRSEQIYEIAGEAFNINSPPQLSKILFDKLQLPALKRNAKTRTASTAVEVLEELALAHDLPRLILDWRGLQKLKGTYIDALPQLVNPETGRVHTCFNQAGAATGRLSSSDPNLQNIPIRTELGREIRRAFIADPGHVLISADYSQIEFRVLAHLAEEEVLIDAFRGGADFHEQTALRLFGENSGRDPHQLRATAKMVNYAVLYGKTAFTLAKDINVPTQAAQEFIDAYFAGFPKVRGFIERTLAEARVSGFVQTLYGRRRLVPELNSRNGQMRAAAERAATNHPIQGTAADIMKRAMIDVDRTIAPMKDVRMILTVHDELLFEVPSGRAEEVAAAVQAAMQDAAVLNVPLTVDVGIGENWKDAKD